MSEMNTDGPSRATRLAETLLKGLASRPPLEDTNEVRLVDNPTLKAIRERRSATQFTSDPVSDELIEAILEAGRWAPSGLNSQPWEFVVVRDPEVRAGMASILQQITFFWKGFATAPVMIVVAVDADTDPAHVVEDGAVAAQFLCLAARSLGLATSWAGVHGGGSRRRSAQHKLRRLLSLPKGHRVIAVIPIGSLWAGPRSDRRPLSEMTHRDRYDGSPASRLLHVGA